MDARKTYESWLEDPYFDEDTKAELRGIAGDADEIGERFYRDLEFGTGGLRGIIGAGTNRMNIYTVRKATQGLANYIIKEHAEKKGVAIAFDSRNMSPEFAQEAALCLAANGIRAYIFPSLRPTPMLSFALRDLGCTAGIVVKASHNPPSSSVCMKQSERGAGVQRLQGILGGRRADHISQGPGDHRGGQCHHRLRAGKNHGTGSGGGSGPLPGDRSGHG